MKNIGSLCLIVCVALFLSGCTYSINMSHSKGTATDIIDANPTPTVEANV